LAVNDIRSFGLEFAWPVTHWVAGQIALGQRHFAATERFLQSVEDAVANGREPYHAANARCLRARLLLQNGDPEGAFECVRHEPEIKLPTWEGEFLATRALALACLGDGGGARRAAAGADKSSIAAEVRVLAQTARAVSEVEGPEGRGLVAMAVASNVWDPVVCGVRSSAALAERLTSDATTRATIAELYQRTQDSSLARRAGIRIRSTTSPDELLTRREVEVLGLIARGYRTQDIAKALFIAESTAKVHIRHVFEKLGARTRSEAVARYQMFEEARVKRSP
jgi:ATP/maltotriose-dependent transcriptional regulator MalT